MEAQYGLRCLAIVTLSELIAALEAPGSAPGLAPTAEQLAALRAYRLKYGVGAP
jgi:hypothetical protein